MGQSYLPDSSERETRNFRFMYQIRTLLKKNMREESWTIIQGGKKTKVGRLLEIWKKDSKQIQKIEKNRKKIVVRE